MAIVDVGLMEESQTRYLTYALSVVNSRALPDVRDGLKPVQRRILYAMMHDLHLDSSRSHRKSAAVVGEVLARYHPHGDAACYEALVRMAQDFNVRYPLIDGQGNFGSLDGDSAAAYRYTEARLTAFASEVIGDIGEHTVTERENFDQTAREPVVLPCRVPNLLVNGCSGIAVGMATAIPPHNICDIVKALVLLVKDKDVADSVLIKTVQAPDFPTGCAVVNTKEELRQIYTTGRGAIRMRAEYTTEDLHRGKKTIVVTSIPYGIDKSVLVEKIADLIIGRKVPQLVDIRDESTDEVRVVMELASGADAEAAMAFLFKHTNLQINFNVNLTAIIPTGNPFTGKPTLLSLRNILDQFVTFRLEVTRLKLTYEKEKLQKRIHLLEGLMLVIPFIKEVIEIVQKSQGRSDSAKKIIARFSLTEEQAFFIVDLRIYQLSKTSMGEVQFELDEKVQRVKEIDNILKSEERLRDMIAEDLQRIVSEFGDARRSRIVSTFEEVELDETAYIENEDVYVIVTKDGWVKRIKQTNDLGTTRIREGDEIFFTASCSTLDSLALFSSAGNVFVTRVSDVVATSGYGVPVQKMFRFGDGEQIVACRVVDRVSDDGDDDQNKRDKNERELFFFTERGLGLRLSSSHVRDTKKVGKRLVRLRSDDRLAGVIEIDTKRQMLFLVSQQGYGLVFLNGEVPLLTNAGKGVLLHKMTHEDKLVSACCVKRQDSVVVSTKKGTKEVSISSLTIEVRARRGHKIAPKIDAVEKVQVKTVVDGE